MVCKAMVLGLAGIVTLDPLNWKRYPGGRGCPTGNRVGVESPRSSILLVSVDPDREDCGVATPQCSLVFPNGKKIWRDYPIAGDGTRLLIERA